MNPRDAEAELREALEFDPQNVCARIELGTLYEDQGEFAQAAGQFERAIAVDPNHGGSHCQLGRIYRRQGRWSEAETALLKALGLDPQSGWARFEMGVLYQDQGRFVEAGAEFERAVAIDPNNGSAHGHLGRICRRQGRLAEAEAALHRALELDPQNAGLCLELGALYEQQSDFSRAAANHERAVAMNPNHGGMHCDLGRIYRRQGRLSEAEAELHKALELDPRNGWVRIELGSLYEGQNRLLAAAAEFEKAVAIDPDNVSAHLCLGHVQIRLVRWAEAEAEFQRAAALAPRNDKAHVGLWAVYRGQGRMAAAEAALAKAVAINPNSVFDCTELLDRIGRESTMDGLAAGAGGNDRGVPGRCGPAGSDAPFLPSPAQDIPKELMRERVFCLMPWTQLHFRADGWLRPCCVWSGPPLGNAHSASLGELWNSAGMKALRSDMMNGRPVAGCWRCYKDEQLGFLSMRQGMNSFLSRHRGRERLTAPDGALPRLAVPFLDINFSNVCNLRCRTCGLKLSSAWMADTLALGLPAEGGPIHRPYADWDSLWRQLRPLLEEEVEEIVFIGGEPLLMEEHYRILDFLIARGRTDVRLRYNTNFSTLRHQGRDILDLWSRFREVKVHASLDGSGRRGEYLRKGLSWDAVVANRQEMLRRCPDVGFSIYATLSIFNALHLPDFHREWVEKGYIERNEFMLNLLRDPAHYRMQVLPAALKQRVLESYRRHRESFLDAGGTAARDFADAERSLQTQDCSDLLPGFVAMTRRLDQLRGEDCREVFPELAGLFEAAA